MSEPQLNIFISTYADARGLRVVDCGDAQGVCNNFMDSSLFELFTWPQRVGALVTDALHGITIFVISHQFYSSYVCGRGNGNSQKFGNLPGRLSLEGRVCDGPEGLSAALDVPVAWTNADATIDDGSEAGRAYLADQVLLCRERNLELQVSCEDIFDSSDCVGCGIIVYVCPTFAIAVVGNPCNFVLLSALEAAYLRCGRCARASHTVGPAQLRRSVPVVCYGVEECDCRSDRRSASCAAEVANVSLCFRRLFFEDLSARRLQRILDNESWREMITGPVGAWVYGFDARGNCIKMHERYLRKASDVQ